MTNVEPNEPDDDGWAVPFSQVAIWYVGILFVGGLLMFVISMIPGVGMQRAALLVCGALFLLAAIRRPRRIYDTFRNISWYALAPGPLLRLGFGVIGVVGIAAALFG